MPKVRPDDWTSGPFVRVYLSLPGDRPNLYDDDTSLAWWLRLLLRANGAWPGPADLPRAIPDAVVDTFEALEVIDRVGTDRYRFHGLARLRGSSQTFAV